MTAKFGRTILAGAILAAVPHSGSAQEFFREYGTSRSSGGIGPVVASDYSYEDVSPTGLAPLNSGQVQDESKDHNFAIGPVRFSMAAGIGVEFNDNITFSENNRESDIVIRPSVSLEASWAVSDRNVLRFNMGISYAKYLDHSEYDTDGVLFAPNSALEYTFGLGPSVLISLRERFSYQEDAFDIATVSDVAKYERYENQVGFEIAWTANSKTTVNLGYDHYNLWSPNDFFEEQDRAIDTVFIKPSYQVTEAMNAGLNVSYSRITFESDARSDGYSLMVGPFINWNITTSLSLFAEVGFQQVSFDGDYQPRQIVDRFLDQQDLDRDQEAFVRQSATDDDTDSSSFYTRFEVNHDLSDSFKHRLSGSKTTEVGFFTNTYDLYHVEYSADWKINRKNEVSPTVFYEYYETSGDFGEEAHRLGAALGFRHYLTNSITVGLDYRFIYKDSNLEGFDYYQNLGFVSLFYKF